MPGRFLTAGGSSAARRVPRKRRIQLPGHQDAEAMRDGLSERKFDLPGQAALEGFGEGGVQNPSVRGWLVGLLSCAFIALIVPYVDFAMRCTNLSLNLLPASSVLLTFVGVLAYNGALARWRKILCLKRQDLALIFCMTALINPIAGAGFMSYFGVETMGQMYFARPENRWTELIQAYIPHGLTPHDPANPLSNDPRPVEWFFSGIPNGRAIPWNLLAGPYLCWCAALLLILGMYLAACLLLYKQWNDHERLPFPLAQVPLVLMDGMEGRGDHPPFFKDRLAWTGIIGTFVLHSWNALGDYLRNWPTITLKYDSIDWTYLTEPPMSYLRPLAFIVFPSVIGIMYLTSLEVSFSLWFFFLVVLKLGVVVAVLQFGMGTATNTGPAGVVFYDAGTGACFALVLASLFMARHSLWKSLRQALGLEPQPPGDPFSPRTLWLTLLVCLLGSWLWLILAGVGAGWGLLALVILLASGVGVTRIVSESGLFFLQLGSNPADLLSTLFSPVHMGSQNFVMLSVWSRSFAFDWNRSNPMINTMGSLHVGSAARLNLRALAGGLCAAVVLCMAVAFFSFYGTGYLAPGGARTFGWNFERYPVGEFNGIAANVSQIEALKEKQRTFAEAGKEVPESELPNAARPQWRRGAYMLAGAGVLFLFAFLRTRLFWWPHPIGFVMWMGMWPLQRMWFSYFLGWLCKALILKFGGHKVYQRWKGFFIGLIVGEALATAVWILVAWLTGLTDGYAMHYD
ncbi:MAG: hypothetical protein HY291_11920 [Planctomycetes bacterium]|nr:hypothetical protein [Planctomycetota bacterium]